MDDDLPPGWAWATLADVSDVIGGITVDKGRSDIDAIEVPYLRVANVQRARLDLRTMRTIKVREGRLAQLRLRRGDVLLNEGGDRDKVGRGWVWEDQIEPCVFQNHVFRARVLSDAMNPFFLSLFLNEFGRKHFLSGAKQTTNLASISLSAVKAAPVVVAPRALQDRIVHEVQSLFEELDEAEAALQRARDGVAQLRASLLHAACTGQLTAAWREANPPAETGADLLARILEERGAAWERSELARLRAKGTTPSGNTWKMRYVEPAPPNVDGLPNLPSGWSWASLSQLGEFGRGKSKHRPRDDPRLYGDAIPFIQTGDVSRSDGRITTYSQRYSPFGIAQSKIWPRGTICITIAANIAASGILEFEACFPDSIVGLSCTDPSIATYAEAFIRTVRSHLEEYAPATAQKNINLETLNALALPLPPLEEIRKIVESVRDANEVVSALPMVTGPELRQSILHAAFTGRLVPQDPADEPASALLRRLRGAPARPTRRARKAAAE